MSAVAWVRGIDGRSQKVRHAEVMAGAYEHGEVLPADALDRHDCKVLVKAGMLEPRPPLGYKPTAKALRKRT